MPVKQGRIYRGSMGWQLRISNIPLQVNAALDDSPSPLRRVGHLQERISKMQAQTKSADSFHIFCGYSD